MTTTEVHHVLLLGPVHIRSQTTASERQLARRERALLARLALDLDRVVSASRLIDDLWAQSPPPSATNALQVYISHLRRRLGPEAIVFSGAGYRMASDVCSVDVQEVEPLVRRAGELLTAGRADDSVTMLDEALAWWRGDALSDLQDYEFARVAAAQLNDLRATAAQHLAEALLACGQPDRVVADVTPLLHEFPFREQLRAAVMTGLYRQGRAVDALELYNEVHALMREELGLDPGPGLQALQAAILADDPALMRAASQYQAAADGIKRHVQEAARESPRTNLDVQPTPLLGRTTEIGEITDLLSGQRSRLVTLTGPGGTGKTRLALQVAADAVEDFAGGVYLVSLASVTDAEVVVPTIAQTLGAKEGSGRTAPQALRELLAGRRVLLVLDNFEQVIAAAPEVANLLSTCPELCVLVTSRESLRLPGEQSYPVPPLAVPGEQAIAQGDAEALSQYEAVRLFVDRAQSARQGFSVTNENAPAVAQICSRLDGLPLAIELAAARTRVLTPEEMLPRLARRLDILSGGPRGAPARQQTLRGAIDWSYDLLDEDEQRLFARLAVFVDGCDLEAVEAVCDPDDDFAASVLDVLTSLVDKSLVRTGETSHGSRRLSMLETVREYAGDRFSNDVARDAVREAHARHFTDLAHRAGWQLQRMEGRASIDRLEREHGNLCAALHWSVEHHRDEEGLSLVDGMWRFWVKSGRLREGTTLARGAIEKLDGRHTPAWAGAMTGLGELYRAQGDLLNARLIKQATLPYLQESSPVRATVTLTDLGHIAQDEGRLDDALTLHTTALQAHRSEGDDRLIAHALMGLARLCLVTGRIAESKSHYEFIMKVGHKYGEAEHINEAMIGLGEAARREGDDATAQAMFAEGLSFALRMGDLDFALDAFTGMASVAVNRGDMLRATVLVGVADGMRARTGLVPYFQDERARNLELARRALGDPEQAAALEAGRAMTLEDAASYALLG